MTTKAEDFGPKLSPVKWAWFRRTLLETGTYDPHIWDELSPYQKQWAKDTLNTLKSYERN